MVITVGDIYEFAVVHVFGVSDEQINVYRLQCSVGGIPTESEFADDMHAMFAGLYSVIQSRIWAGVDAHEIRYRNITDDGATVFTPWTGTYNGGSGGADALPPQNCALLLERTGTKNVVGKKYLPTFTEATQDAGVLTSEVIDDLEDFGTYLMTSMVFTDTGVEWVPVVYSRKLDEHVLVTAVQPRTQLAIQRRRRVGRGS